MFDLMDLIDNRFRVQDQVGQGGMGVVLRVLDKETGDTVALKYSPEGDLESRRRFAREVRVMASIQHKNVMPILHHNLEHNPPYFTMPLAKHSIAEELAEDLEEDEALDIFKQICLGIQAIHNADAMHRDIKPLNAMRMPDGRIVVSDMGLAKLDPRDTTTLTQTTAFLGTRWYSAPEQLLGDTRDADSRTDVYQLGKVLYRLLD